MHAALASSLASIVLTGLSSARAHHRRGSVLWPTVAWLVPGLLLGGWLGSGLAVRLDAAWLKLFIAAYCGLAAVQMALDLKPKASWDGSVISLLNYPEIDYQDQFYYATPKSMAKKPKSLDEVDPKLLATYEKLGVPLHERARLAGVFLCSSGHLSSFGVCVCRLRLRLPAALLGSKERPCFL